MALTLELLIPGVTLPSSEAATVARQHIVDGVDTETGEVLEDHTRHGNSNSPAGQRPSPRADTICRNYASPSPHVLAQYIGEGGIFITSTPPKNSASRNGHR
ncbi:hypothetical protein KCP76_19440 [Salmonella enterica subsp. enterica serovar Weltevreden]|nr:hypothetical protein KCP76_19440 [Salmonella enterica subsp. enterica serovar Weltevreden]